MHLKYQKITTVIALLVTVAVGQLYIGVTFSEPNSGASVSVTAPQPIMGILTTSQNKPILVNGASAISGATIPTGATIETPDNVGATIRLGALGSLCIAPNTKLVLEFDRQGKLGNVKVNLTEGCAILRTMKDTAGTFNTAQGLAGHLRWTRALQLTPAPAPRQWIVARLAQRRYRQEFRRQSPWPLSVAARQ